MSDKTDPIFAAGGWVAPSALVYDVESAFDAEFDEEVAAWPQAVRGGQTYTVTFNTSINADSFRILTGWGQPPYQPDLETLL